MIKTRESYFYFDMMANHKHDYSFTISGFINLLEELEKKGIVLGKKNYKNIRFCRRRLENERKYCSLFSDLSKKGCSS